MKVVNIHPLLVSTCMPDFKRLRNASHIYACAHSKPKIYGYGRNVHLRHFPWPKCPWPKCPGRNVHGRNVRGRNVRAHWIYLPLNFLFAPYLLNPSKDFH